MRQAHQHAAHISSQQQQPTGGGRQQIGPRRGGSNYYPQTGGSGFTGNAASAHAPAAGTMPNLTPAFQLQQQQALNLAMATNNPVLQVLLNRGVPMATNVGVAPTMASYGNYNPYSGMQNGMFPQMQNSTGLPNNNNYRTQGGYGSSQTTPFPAQQPSAVGYNIMAQGTPGVSQNNSLIGSHANGYTNTGVGGGGGDYSSAQSNITGQASTMPFGASGPASALSGSNAPPGVSASSRSGVQTNYNPSPAQFNHVSGRSNSISGPTAIPFQPAHQFNNPSFPPGTSNATPVPGGLYQPPFTPGRPAQPATPGGTGFVKRERRPITIVNPSTGQKVDIEPVASGEQQANTTATPAVVASSATVEGNADTNASSADGTGKPHAAAAEVFGSSNLRAAAAPVVVEETNNAVSGTKNDGEAKHALDVQNQFAQKVATAAASAPVPGESDLKEQQPISKAEQLHRPSDIPASLNHFQVPPGTALRQPTKTWHPPKPDDKAPTVDTDRDEVLENNYVTGATTYSSASAGTDMLQSTPSDMPPTDAKRDIGVQPSSFSSLDENTPPSLHVADDHTPTPLGTRETTSPVNMSARSSPDGLTMHTPSGHLPSDEMTNSMYADEDGQFHMHRPLGVVREDSETAERVAQQQDRRRSAESSSLGNRFENNVLKSKDAEDISTSDRIRYKLEKLMEIGQRVKSPAEGFLPNSVEFLRRGMNTEQNDSGFNKPFWAKPKPPGGGGGGGGGGGKQQMVRPLPKYNTQTSQIIINIPKFDAELNKAAHAWKPNVVERKKDDQSEKIFKEVRAIMNKLTPNNIDKLKEKLAALEINTEEEVEGVVNIIFDKALDEPNFCQLYALMTNHMMVKRSADTDTEEPGTGKLIRGELLKRLQKEFEKIKAVEQSEDGDVSAFKVEGDGELTKEDIELKQSRLKKRYLGNIRFVGELYAVQMIPIRIILYCMSQLMPKPADMRSGKCSEFCEEKLESLCKLIMSVGQKVASENYDIDGEPLNIIKRFRELCGKKTATSSRLRFTMLDVIEAAKGKWKVATGTQIKTIEQIHEDFHTKKEEDEVKAREDMRKLRAKGTNVITGRRPDGHGMPHNASSSHLSGQGGGPSYSTMPMAYNQSSPSSGGGSGGLRKSNTDVNLDAMGGNRRQQRQGGGLQTTYEHGHNRTMTGGDTPTQGGSSRTASPGGADDGGKQPQQQRKFLSIISRHTSKQPSADQPG